MAIKRTHHNAEKTAPTSGRKVVTSAATAVALVATSTPVLWADLTAETDNTGTIVVGDSAVVAALATRKGTPLAAGDTQTLYDVDLADIYLDATVSTDGVTFCYVAGSS